MKKMEIKELEHLKNSIPKGIAGYSLGFYSIALEAYRRGLNVKFLNKSIHNKAATRYVITSGDKKYVFSGSRNRTLTTEVRKITNDKQKTKDCLEKNNVPIAKGQKFSELDTTEDIINYGIELGFPLVVKPIDGHAGKGVIAGINNRKEFEKSLEYVREELGYKNIIVEKFFKGEDYRVFVVGEEVVAITKRYPANVLGDGKSTIEELIKEKNKMRKQHPMLSVSLIKVDTELKDMLLKQNLNLTSIPPKNKLIILKPTNNISTGGDPVDITDDVSEELKEIAINAVRSIPGLKNGGVDLMVNEKDNTAIVLEVNSQASIRSHLYPVYGEPRDIPSKLIDIYFPETKGIKRNTNVYIDFDPIWKSFLKGAIDEYELPNIPIDNYTISKIRIKGDVKRKNFGDWIRRQAIIHNIHGYVKMLKSEGLDIIALGEVENFERFKTLVLDKTPETIAIIDYEVIPYNRIIKAGFYIENVDLDEPLPEGYQPTRINDFYYDFIKSSVIKRIEVKENKLSKTKREDVKKVSLTKEKSNKRTSIFIKVINKIRKKLR